MPNASGVRFHTGKTRSYRASDREYVTNDRRKPDEHGAGHDRVADRDLVEKRQVAEHGEIGQIEVVARVDAEAERVGETQRLRMNVANELAPALGAALERARERLRYNSMRSAPHRRGPANRVRLGVDEQADARVVRMQALDDVGNPRRSVGLPPQPWRRRAASRPDS